MATGLHNKARRLLLAIIVTAMVLIASVYVPVSLETGTDWQITPTALAAHASGGGD